MSKYTIATFGAILGVFSCVWGDATMSGAASRAWVTNYVAEAIASSRAEIQSTATITKTNGVTEIVAGDGVRSARLIIEDSSDAAFRVTNATAVAVSAGITNGLYFVWNGAGAYINPSGVISCTATNLVYLGIPSVRVDGAERFSGWFDAVGVLIQPRTSLSVTNGMAEVAK